MSHAPHRGGMRTNGFLLLTLDVAYSGSIPKISAFFQTYLTIEHLAFIRSFMPFASWKIALIIGFAVSRWREPNRRTMRQFGQAIMRAECQDLLLRACC